MVRKPAPKPKAARPKREGPTAASMVESIFGCAWSPRILALLAEGCSDPDSIRQECPGLSAKLLSERLRTMTRFGLAGRTAADGTPPAEAEYTLTPLGHRFMRILDEVERLQAAMDGRK